MTRNFAPGIEIGACKIRRSAGGRAREEEKNARSVRRNSMGVFFPELEKAEADESAIVKS